MDAFKRWLDAGVWYSRTKVHGPGIENQWLAQVAARCQDIESRSSGRVNDAVSRVHLKVASQTEQERTTQSWLPCRLPQRAGNA